MTSRRLVTPDLINDACLEVVDKQHAKHLAALERDRGFEPRTIEPFQTVDLLAGEGFRLREDQLPCVLLGVFSTADTPEQTPKRTLDFSWYLGAEVTVFGVDRADTIKRREWYSLTFAECLLTRLPRMGEPIDGIKLEDIDNTNISEGEQNTIATSRLIFTVSVRDGLSFKLLPDLPADDPYADQPDWATVETVTTNVERESV